MDYPSIEKGSTFTTAVNSRLTPAREVIRFPLNKKHTIGTDRRESGMDKFKIHFDLQRRKTGGHGPGHCDESMIQQTLTGK
jgi:hypothetical protein